MADIISVTAEPDVIRNSSVSALTMDAYIDPMLSAKRGHVEFFKGVEGDVIKNSRDELDSCALCVASVHGHLNCCQVIYKRCPELLYHSNIHGHTALHEAAYNGESEIIKFLLTIGVKQETVENGEQAVDYRLLMMVNTANETALHLAAQRNKVESAKVLLEADRSNKLLRIENRLNQTALHFAVEKHYLEMVKLLVETDPNFVYPPDASGKTPLLLALEESLLGDETADAIRKILIEKLSSQCKLPTGPKGWSLLHFAVSKGDLSSIEDIIQFCPECIGLVDIELQNFLHLAAKFGHENIVRYVMGSTNIGDGVLNGKDIHGNTPLHIATSRGNAGIGLALLYNPKVKKLIVNNQGKTAFEAINFEYDKTKAGVYEPMVSAKRGNADFFEEVEVDVIKNSRDDLSASVLSIASIHGHLNCCQVICRRCPELLYHSNIRGHTALHEAAYNGENEIIKFLLRAGIRQQDIETEERGEQVVDYRLLMMVNASKETALHSAVLRGNFQAAKLLLEADHNNKLGLLRMVNISNQTAMHIAVEKRNFEMVKLLVETDPYFVYPPDASGQTPLYKALQESFSGDITAVAIRKILIEKFPDHCKLPTGPRQWTLLHHAANKGDLSSIQDIIQFSPECLPLVDSEHQSFLHLATKIEHENIVRYTMGLTNIDESVLNGKDMDGNTPLHIATSRGHAGMALALLYNPKVDKFVLNNQGKNALEAINFEYDRRRAGVYGYIQRLDENDLRDRSDFDLLVGALISTVSFTAGITVPGGFFSDGPNQGNAVLHKKKSFEAFVVSNTIALVLSLYAVFCHFCTRRLISEASISYQLKVATYCSLGAIFAMLIAFISGSYAVLAISNGLAITVCVICCCFFGFSFRAIWRMIKEQRQRQHPSLRGENCLSFLGLNN